MRLTVLTLISVATAACNGGTLGPSQAIELDPLLRDLPAGATLIAGANLRHVRQSPIFDAWLEATGTDLDALESSLQVQTGMYAGSEALVDMRFACGEGGCAGLVAGDLSGFSAAQTASTLNRAAERLGVEPQKPAAGLERPMALAAAMPDVSARLPRGEPLILQLVAPDRALFGDSAAVTAAAAPQAPELDVSELEGAVPAGDFWIVMRDASDLFEQAAARMEQNGSASALRMAERLRQPVGPHRRAAGKLETVAFAVDGVDPMVARARTTCRSTVAAVAIEQMARAALLRLQVGGSTDAIRRAAGDATVVRVGRQIEVSLTWAAADVLAALEEAREVAQ